jgi:hypothetical protein
LSHRIPHQTTRQYYRVDRREISFLRFIVEAYDGLALVRTVDARKGIVVLHMAPGCEEEARRLIASLRAEILIEPLASPPAEDHDRFMQSFASDGSAHTG